MKRTNQMHEKNRANAAYQRGIVGIIKTGKGFTPEWDGARPGEHPALPLLPPGRTK